MRADQFIRSFENKLKHQFNVYTKDDLGTMPLRFSAHYYRKDERYMMTKDITIWSVENNQHFFLYETTQATESEFEQFKQELDAYIFKHRATTPSHMSSIYIGLFFITQTPNPSLIKKAKRSRKVSFIKWGLHGWYERYIGILSLDSMDIHMNRKGKPFIQPFIEPLKSKNEVNS